MRIAFIGLGAMGGPMARNLTLAGMNITVYNRDPAKMDDLARIGAQTAASALSAAHEAEIVCTCVSTPDALRSVLIGSDGAIAGAQTGTIFLDLSTVDPATSRELAGTCQAAGHSYIEAPVSGGVGGAKNGTLTIIVGADPAAYESALPVLNIVGKQIVHVGPVGAGSTIKLINQMLVGANLAAVLEAFVLGKVAGIEPEALYDVIGQSSGSSGMLSRAVPGNLLPRKFEPGFTLGLLLKDLGLAIGLAEDLGVSVPLTSAARRVYEEGKRSGLEQLDMTAAILPIERKHGIEIKATKE